MIFLGITVYALIAESYGHYSFVDVILQPEHIFTFTFSVLGIIFFVIETTAKLRKKQISTKFIVLTFIILIIAPIIVFGGSGLNALSYEYKINREEKLIKENSDTLEKILFDENFSETSNPNIDDLIAIKNKNYKLEDQLRLMIKVSPEKTLTFIKNSIEDNNINHNLTLVTGLRGIEIKSPELLSEVCNVAREIVKIEIARSDAENPNYRNTDVRRLENYLRDLPKKCGGVGL